MILGNRLGALIAQRGLSQSELARRVGISQGAIAHLVSGRSRSSSELHRIAHELDTTPEYLTGETNDPEADYTGDHLSSDERVWLELLRGLEPKDRAAVLQLTRSLAHSAATPAVHSGRREYRT